MSVSNEQVETALMAYFGPTMYSIAKDAAATKRAMRAALETLPPPDLPWRVSDVQRGLILFRTSNNAHGSINFSSLSYKIQELPEPDRAELVALLRAVASSIEMQLHSPTEAGRRALARPTERKGTGHE